MLEYDHKHSKIDYSKDTKEIYQAEQQEVVLPEGGDPQKAAG